MRSYIRFIRFSVESHQLAPPFLAHPCYNGSMDAKRHSQPINHDYPDSLYQGVIIEDYRGPKLDIQIHYPTAGIIAVASDEAPPAALHFDAFDSRVTDWVLWGIACPIIAVPVLILFVIPTIIYFGFAEPLLVTLISILPGTILLLIGLINSIKSLLAFHRSPHPVRTAALSLAGLAMSVFVIYYCVLITISN